MKLHEEFKLYETMWDTVEAKDELNEGFVDTIKNIAKTISDKVDAVAVNSITKQVIRNMNKAYPDTETSFSDDEAAYVFESDTNGSYRIKEENFELVKKLDILANAIYDCNIEHGYDDAIAGFEIFIYLLSTLRIPFAYYDPSDIEADDN
jgi:hypothetical protein